MRSVSLTFQQATDKREESTIKKDETGKREWKCPVNVMVCSNKNNAKS